MHQIRRRAVGTAHLDDLAVAALVANALPSNADAISYGCFHDAPPRWSDSTNETRRVRRSLGPEVPARPLGGVSGLPGDPPPPSQ